MSDKTPDSASDILMQAIMNKTTCLVQYNGEHRVIEPHVLGTTTAGNRAVRVWQLAGGSLSDGEVPHWRLLRLDRITSLESCDSPSRAPRPDYNPEDRHMASIEAAIVA